MCYFAISNDLVPAIFVYYSTFCVPNLIILVGTVIAYKRDNFLLADCVALTQEKFTEPGCY
jgi:hypothetical protein